MEKMKRPKRLIGNTECINCGCGKLYITVNAEEAGVPFEIFAHLGKSGGCAASQTEALTRAITIGLRHGIEAKQFVDQLRGISCPSVGFDEGDKILSCADALAKVLQRTLNGRGETPST